MSILKAPLLIFHFYPEYSTKGFINADVLLFPRVATSPYFSIILTFPLEAAFLAKFPSDISGSYTWKDSPSVRVREYLEKLILLCLFRLIYQLAEDC